MTSQNKNSYNTNKNKSFKANYYNSKDYKEYKDYNKYYYEDNYNSYYDEYSSYDNSAAFSKNESYNKQNKQYYKAYSNTCREGQFHNNTLNESYKGNNQGRSFNEYKVKDGKGSQENIEKKLRDNFVTEEREEKSYYSKDKHRNYLSISDKKTSGLPKYNDLELVNLNQTQEEQNKVNEKASSKEEEEKDLKPYLDHNLKGSCFIDCTRWRVQIKQSIEKQAYLSKYTATGLFLTNHKASLLDTLDLIDKVSEINENTQKSLFNKTLDNQEKYFSKEKGKTIPFSSKCFQGQQTIYITAESSKLLKKTSSASHENSSEEISMEISKGFSQSSFVVNVNGICHENKVFACDQRFYIEGSEFISSIIQRLKSHQSEFIKKRKKIVQSNPGFDIENHKFSFFTRLEKYPNLGFEFSIPKSINVEDLDCNSSCIVQYQLSITKIHIEVKQVRDKEDYNNLKVTKSTVDMNNGLKNCSIYATQDSQRNLNPGASNRSEDNNNQPLKPRKAKSKPISAYDLEGELLSKNSRSKITDLQSKSSLNMEGSFSQNAVSVAAQVNESISSSKKSKKIKTSNKGKNSEMQKESFDQAPSKVHKNSFQLNQINSDQNCSINNNNNTNAFTDEYSRNSCYKSCYSSKNESEYKNSSSSAYSEYMECREYNQDLSDKFFSEIRNSNSLQSKNTPVLAKSASHQPGMVRERFMNIKSVLEDQCTNSCNLFLFYNKANIGKMFSQENLTDMTLGDFISSIEEQSAFGLDINYWARNSFVPVNYSPSLSFIKLSVSSIHEDTTISNFLSQLKNDITISKKEMSSDEGFYFLKNGLMIQQCKDKLVFYFSENKHFHSRRVLSSELLNLFPETIQSLKLSKFSKESYIGILWNANVLSNQTHSTSFITYHQFVCYDESASDEEGSNDKRILFNSPKEKKITFIGLLPIKFDKSFFLTCISKVPGMSLEYQRTFDFGLCLKNSIHSVYDHIFNSYSCISSIDYDNYLKNECTILGEC